MRLSQVELFGVDLVVERVRAAAEAARGVNAHVNYAAADATSLPFGDGLFDSTYCVAVLQHVRDVGEAVAELARVTRPGGRLLIVEPDNAARYWFSSAPERHGGLRRWAAFLHRPGPGAWRVAGRPDRSAGARPDARAWHPAGLGSAVSGDRVAPRAARTAQLWELAARRSPRRWPRRRTNRCAGLAPTISRRSSNTPGMPPRPATRSSRSRTRCCSRPSGSGAT